MSLGLRRWSEIPPIYGAIHASAIVRSTSRLFGEMSAVCRLSSHSPSR